MSDNYTRESLLNIYLEMYNHTNRQIDLLYETLDEIREGINTIAGVHPGTTHSNHFRFRPFYRNNTFQANRGTGTRTRVNPTRTPSINYTSLFDALNSTTFNNAARHNNNSFYDSVPVYPTTEQINRATRVVPFSSIENPVNNSCPITLANFHPDSSVMQILHCGHIFSSENINMWFRNNVRCPVCRYDIREYNVQDNSNQQPLQDDEPIPDLVENTQQENDDQVILNTFNNLTGTLLANLLTNSSDSNPVEFENSRYFVDSSNNQLIFEGFLRNSFR